MRRYGKAGNMNPDREMTATEAIDLMCFVARSEDCEERTRSAARLGRHLMWDHVSAMHDEDFVEMLPDEFWEAMLDSYFAKVDAAIHGNGADGREGR